MSPREIVQNQIVEALNKRSDYFDAPYGIIDSIAKTSKGGKIRTVTFGVARYLDGYIEIFSPNRIKISGQGGLAYKYEGNYKSVEEVLDVLKK